MIKTQAAHEKSLEPDADGWLGDWTLIDAIGITDGIGGRGIQGTFQSGSDIQPRNWIFPNLSPKTIDTALGSLREYIGCTVTAVLELPPTDLWIHFADGKSWGVSP
jgi:hypothetical protein